jgi:hypothetical protein
MFLIPASLSLIFGAAHARPVQDGGATPPKNSTATAAALTWPLTGLEIDLQSARNYNDKTQSNYVNVVFNNRSIYETGKKVDETKLDLSNDVKLANADPGFLLNYRNGSGSIGGNFFTTNDIAPINFTSKLLRGLNSYAEVGAGTDGTKPLEVALGIQTKPLHPLMGLKFVPNWLTIGVNGHYRSETGQETTTVAEANFKTYASTAIWTTDAKRGGLDYQGWVNKNAATWKSAVSHFDNMKTQYNDGTDAEQQVLVAYDSYKSTGLYYPDAATAARKRLGLKDGDPIPQDQLLTDADWQRVVKSFQDGYAKAHSYYPAFILYAEAQGAYSLTKDVLYRRYNSLWAAGVKYDLGHFEGAQSCYLELRYEHGFSDATRTIGTNSLLASFDVKF